MASSLSSASSVSTENINIKAKIVKFQHKWTINNFSQITDSVIIRSHFVTPDDVSKKWYLKCHPNGDANDANGYLSLFLLFVETNSINSWANARFRILSSDQTRSKTLSFSDGSKFTFIPKTGWGYPKIIERKTILDPNNGFLNNDKLTIIANISVLILGDDKTVKFFEYSDPKILSDFGSIIKDNKFADFTLNVKGHELMAHKAILSARSPVFAAMFNHSTKEVKENSVTIEDIDSDVMRGLLDYVYSGKISTELIENAEFCGELLKCADKYQIVNLKQICAQKLCSKLTNESVCDILILADNYNVVNLKRKAMDHVIQNSYDVQKTEEWNMIKKNRTHLVIQLCDDIMQNYSIELL